MTMPPNDLAPPRPDLAPGEVLAPRPDLAPSYKEGERRAGEVPHARPRPGQHAAEAARLKSMSGEEFLGEIYGDVRWAEPRGDYTTVEEPAA
jgi:hypothetical protein